MCRCISVFHACRDNGVSTLIAADMSFNNVDDIYVVVFCCSP